MQQFLDPCPPPSRHPSPSPQGRHPPRGRDQFRRRPARRPPADAADSLLSQGKTATASSAENVAFPASAAVDGDPGTRWSSAFGDPQWIQVDLGQTATVSQVAAQLGGGVRDGLPAADLRRRQQLVLDLQHHHRCRRQPDAERHRHRPLRPPAQHASAPPSGATRSGSSRSSVPRRRYRPRPGQQAAVVQQAGVGLDAAERRQLLRVHAGQGVRPRPGQPLGDRDRLPAGSTRAGSTSTSAPPPRSTRSILQWDPASAKAYQIQVSQRREQLDPDLLHHHRHGLQGDAERHRHRPLRPDVRHAAQHAVRVLAVGVPGLRHRRRTEHPADPAGRPGEPAAAGLVRRVQRPRPAPSPTPQVDAPTRAPARTASCRYYTEQQQRPDRRPGQPGHRGPS